MLGALCLIVLNDIRHQNVKDHAAPMVKKSPSSLTFVSPPVIQTAGPTSSARSIADEQGARTRESCRCTALSEEECQNVASVSDHRSGIDDLCTSSAERIDWPLVIEIHGTISGVAAQPEYQKPDPTDTSNANW